MFANLFGGGFKFPYNIQEAYEHSWSEWVHYRGVSKEDKTIVSVFKIELDKNDSRGLEIARNGVKRLRALRHPNFVAFKDTAEQEERTKINIFIVTEQVSPLQSLNKLTCMGMKDNSIQRWASDTSPRLSAF
eukprot:TRINITY_DN21088_c0_g1_i2.p1 TRINITY_DN21088_c0_g1~~TRINITY_DN21088_c0_g1_i2.p1  ORF type:complete len:142 (-),score=2.16 TRINITY_DN21088_c0_g1_i2:40-435(-)